MTAFKAPRVALFMVSLLAMASQSAACQEAIRPSDSLKLEKFNNRYLERNWRTFEGRTEIKVSVYDGFLKIDRNQLGKRAAALYDDAAAIFKSPLDELGWTRYLQDFPREVSEFYEVFCHDGPEGLTRHSLTFMLLIEDAVDDNPQCGIAIILNLSRTEPVFGEDCEAGYRLRDIAAKFFCEQADLAFRELKKLRLSEQQEVFDFICSYENKKAAVLDCIGNKLKEAKEPTLAKMFEQSLRRPYPVHKLD